MNKLFLLDSAVLLELASETPDEGVTAFMCEAKAFIVSSLLFQDLAVSVAKSEGDARRAMASFAENLKTALAGKIVSIDSAIAEASGSFLALKGKKLNEKQAILAAIATLKEAVVVAKEASAYESLGVAALNPFSGKSAKREIRKKAREDMSQQGFLF